MTHSQINLQGTLHKSPNSNGHMYSQEMFENAVLDYINRMRAKRRDGIIDAIVSGEDYDENTDYGEIDRNSIGISHRVESISMEDNIFKVDMVYSPTSRIEFITHDVTILNTGLEL
tara:strand:- start:1449 stop:1796 length:348 start_codon:yes stop_codon:yes gene_type:complete